jgi:hypothetical protein
MLIASGSHTAAKAPCSGLPLMTLLTRHNHSAAWPARLGVTAATHRQRTSLQGQQGHQRCGTDKKCQA